MAISTCSMQCICDAVLLHRTTPWGKNHLSLPGEIQRTRRSELSRSRGICRGSLRKCQGVRGESELGIRIWRSSKKSRGYVEKFGGSPGKSWSQLVLESFDECQRTWEKHGAGKENAGIGRGHGKSRTIDCVVIEGRVEIPGED